MRILVALLLPGATLVAVTGLALLALEERDPGPRPAATEAVATPTPNASPGLSTAPDASVCQGLLKPPAPGQPREFPAEYTQVREAAGVAIVGNAGVDSEAFDVAVETLERMFAANDLATPLAERGAYVVIAESGQGILELPEFGCLEEELGEDFFTHVCGIADRADYPVATVNEDDLLGRSRGPCSGLNILYHEVGHLVQNWSISPDDHFGIRSLYQASMSAGRYEGEYASSNYHEYFAEGTQAYFDHTDLQGRRDREWLRGYDPELFALLERVFGG
jgi:hypothetical protein